MNFHKLTLGDLGTNCYFIADENTKGAIMIDAPDEPDIIEHFLKEQGYTLRYILQTHAHFDHILALKYLKEHTGAEICVHEEEADVLSNKNINHLAMTGINYTPPEADRLLKDGDIIKMDSISVSVLHTPGHTKGGVCYLVENILFSGDTLFRRSIGRTDFPTGDLETEIRSVKEKLLPLGDSVKVYPGHGEPTTIGEERRENPYLI